MHRPLWLVSILLVAFGAAACTAGPLPRELTATAAAEAAPAFVPELAVLPAPTVTPGGISGDADPTPVATANPSIVIWVNETSPAHAAALEAMAAEFAAQSGIQAEMITVAPRLLPELIQTAVLSGTLPDLVLHPMEYTVGWAEAGILDAAAAAAAVEALGADTFAPAALQAVTLPSAAPAALPSDGWKELIIYRQDWFTADDLAPPTSFQALISGTAAIYDPDIGRSGLVVPTESSLVTTQQVFEYLARANGCELIDDRGEVQLLQPACLDALDYYRELINGYSPSDVQTDVSALNAYLAGRTGLIMVPSSVLPQLAGLDPDFPLRCPECAQTDFLVQNSGIVTELTGRSPLARPATFAELTYLGITTAADRDPALAFSEYWFTDGYPRWLAINPERKVPLRGGTGADPTLFLDLWQTLPLVPEGPTLTELIGAATVQQIVEGVRAVDRWAFAAGQGGLMTAVYDDLVLSIVLQEMLSGYFTSSYAIIEAHDRVIALIPGYSFAPEIDLTTTPAP